MDGGGRRFFLDSGATEEEVLFLFTADSLLGSLLFFSGSSSTTCIKTTVLTNSVEEDCAWESDRLRRLLNSLYFMKPEGMFHCSQEPVTVVHAVLVELCLQGPYFIWHMSCVASCSYCTALAGDRSGWLCFTTSEPILLQTMLVKQDISSVLPFHLHMSSKWSIPVRFLTKLY